MTNIRWPRGLYQAQFRAQIIENLDKVLNGNMLVIDPASKTLGYATTVNGAVIDTGTIELSENIPVNQRLQELVALLYNEAEYDILGIEMIRGKMAHHYLKFSVGAVIGAVHAPACIEVPISSWKAYAGKQHKKSDEADAIAMAETIIALAKEIRDESK